MSAWNTTGTEREDCEKPFVLKKTWIACRCKKAKKELVLSWAEQLWITSKETVSCGLTLAACREAVLCALYATSWHQSTAFFFFFPIDSFSVFHFYWNFLSPSPFYTCNCGVYYKTRHWMIGKRPNLFCLENYSCILILWIEFSL